MKKAIDSIFESVHKDLKRNLETAAMNKLASSAGPSLQGSGSIPISFHLDQNGEYHYSISKYGAGVTLHISASINNPDAEYNITVSSSDGGGGQWSNVRINQQLSCDLHTNFWHASNISVTIKANVSNVDGNAQINYNY